MALTLDRQAPALRYASGMDWRTFAVFGTTALTGCGGGSADGTASASASASAEESLTASATLATDGGSSSGVSATSQSTTSADGSGSSDSSAADSTGGIKFDMAPLPDVDAPCGGKGGAVDFSYIWIANSDQGTISKIDTQTLIEHGRYRVRPDSAGSPSRTSVNLQGDVAVANRTGGITKVLADATDCVESNGQPGIQTSSGAADILAWGDEECVAWYTPMAHTTQRPVAWTAGTYDPATCSYADPKVWTAGATVGANGSVVVTRLNGDTGVVEDVIAVPELLVGGFGPYGGAVDGESNFWFIDSGNDRVDAPLVRVDAITLEYEIWTSPAISPYGLAVDTQGRPWIAGFTGGVARFDPIGGTFDVNGDTTGLGMMPDAEGRMWVATHPSAGTGVFALDVDTMAQVALIDLPTVLAWGISVDFYGYVWVVDRGASIAYRVDPDDGSFESYAGLTGAYTYSDMTGWGLNLVTNPEG